MVLGFVLAKLLVEAPRGAAENIAAGKPLGIGEFLGFAMRTGTLRMLLAAFVCSNFVATVMLSWMPKFLYDKFHMSLAMSGLTATLYLQLASLAGSPCGGWLADKLRQRYPGGRMMVQASGVILGAPFVALCGLTQSIPVLIFALAGWGFFKGLYDANIFASVYDVVRPEARGAAAGLMNTVGWLAGGGTAPLAIGIIAEGRSLSFAIAITAVVYLLAAGFLLFGALRYAIRDVKSAA